MPTARRIPREARVRRRLAALCFLFLAAAPAAPPSPQPAASLTFAVIGDGGTGKAEQYAVGRAMASAREKQPFGFVLMLGDNIYGKFQGARSFTERFEKPYADLLRRGVKFYAVLGNHGSAEAETHYDKFGMEGRRYYTFTAGDGLAQFFALDSDTLDATPVDAAQVAWLESQLNSSTARWKIAFFHHPIYNAGLQHGPNLRLRGVLEPLFHRYGVRLGLSGHEHVYQRLKPQNGVLYFVTGSAGKVRSHDIDRTDQTLAAANDSVCSFMLFELNAEELRYQAISAGGEILDSGAFPVTGRP